MIHWLEKQFVGWEIRFGKRMALFFLAISPLVYIAPIALISAVLGWNLIPFNALALTENWTAWVWPLGEKYWMGAFVGASVGLIISIFRIPFLATVFGIFLVFTGFASLSTGLGFLIGEIFLTGLLGWRGSRSVVQKTSLAWNWKLDLASGLALLLVSGFLELLVADILGRGAYSLPLRRVQFFAILMGALGLWTFSKMVFFHFYWQRSK